VPVLQQLLHGELFVTAYWWPHAGVEEAERVGCIVGAQPVQFPAGAMQQHWEAGDKAELYEMECNEMQSCTQ
jgi:hypothetical protein